MWRAGAAGGGRTAAVVAVGRAETAAMAGAAGGGRTAAVVAVGRAETAAMAATGGAAVR